MAEPTPSIPIDPNLAPVVSWVPGFGAAVGNSPPWIRLTVLSIVFLLLVSIPATRKAGFTFGILVLFLGIISKSGSAAQQH